jgi:hypothetical protein
VARWLDGQHSTARPHHYPWSEGEREGKSYPLTHACDVKSPRAVSSKNQKRGFGKGLLAGSGAWCYSVSRETVGGTSTNGGEGGNLNLADVLKKISL